MKKWVFVLGIIFIKLVTFLTISALTCTFFPDSAFTKSYCSFPGTDDLLLSPYPEENNNISSALPIPAVLNLYFALVILLIAAIFVYFLTTNIEKK